MVITFDSGFNNFGSKVPKKDEVTGESAWEKYQKKRKEKKKEKKMTLKNKKNLDDDFFIDED